MLPTVALTLALLAGAGPPAAARSPLVDVARSIPSAVLDLRYATPANFTGKVLYPSARCLLRRAVAARLVKVAARVARKGYRLRLYDCYRPLSVQRTMWAAYPHPGFVADPKRGSLHNRAAAVDVGLSTPEGAEVEMPTPFDHFGPKARAGATAGIPARLRARRDLLRRAMEAEGFIVNPAEWWHYAARDARRFPLLDVPLEDARGAP